MRHYKINDQIRAMDEDKVSTAFNDVEGRTRSGAIKYSAKPSLSKDQMDDIKKTWPPELIDALRLRAKDLAQGKTVDGEVAYPAAKEVLLKEMPRIKDANKACATPARNVERDVLADLALSMTLGVAPNVTSERIRTIKGKKVDVRIMVTTTRIVVNEEDVDNADIYVAVLVNDPTAKAIIVGWVTKEDLKAANRGNRITDPEHCSWSRMSYWIALDKFKPMVDLMRSMGVQSASPGFACEAVPSISDLPIIDTKLDDMIIESTAKDTYYSSLGLEDPAVQQPKPVQEPQKDGFNF